MTIEKVYRDLGKKYSLPDFSKIDQEFEISTIEKEEFLLREIIHKAMDKIEFYTMLINNILHPDNGTLAPLHECRAFDDAQKENLFEMYKVLMHHHRGAILSALNGKENEEAQFISEFYKEWVVIKPKLIEMVTLMQSSWKEQSSMREDLGYLG